MSSVLERCESFVFLFQRGWVFQRGWIAMGLIAVDAGTNGKRQGSKLRRPHLDLQVNNKAANQAEGDLRDNEPKPVDARIQNGTDDAQCRVNDSGPEKWGDEACSKNGLPGKHGQHRTIE